MVEDQDNYKKMNKQRKRIDSFGLISQSTTIRTFASPHVKHNPCFFRASLKLNFYMKDKCEILKSNEKQPSLFLRARNFN